MKFRALVVLTEKSQLHGTFTGFIRTGMVHQVFGVGGWFGYRKLTVRERIC